MAAKQYVRCKECGKPIGVYPPNISQIHSSLEKKPDSIEMTVKCEKGHKAKIYWHRSTRPVYTRP